MSDYEFIDVDVRNGVARLTTNRPAVRNAQSRRLLEELDDAFARAGADRGVKVIALFGAGDHFSGGHDLGTADERADREARPLQPGLRGRFDHSRENYVEKTLRWRNVPKPTIAGVQGYCIFAGWLVASAMDIIYAADNAMFLGANFQYFSIPWDVHPRKAKEMLYESRFIDAEEAMALGLVNRVVPLVDLEGATIEYAERVAKNDPFQLRMKGARRPMVERACENYRARKAAPEDS
ncbi:MAG: enoyl-CoA hydratase-related protein [Gammaproteobacteria bacterium]